MNLIIIIAVVALIIAIVGSLLPYFLIVLGIYILYRIVRYIMKNRYFNSPEFLEQKDKVDTTIAEYNDIAQYVKDIPNNNQFVPLEDKHEYAHLATFENTSVHQYKRDKNKKTLNKSNVYQSSLQIVRKASEEPIKYLCKYFNIKPTEDSLRQIEEIGTNISRMENTVENLTSRQQRILEEFNPPKYILKYYNKELMKKLGAEIPEISVEYAEYVFEYVSAGGNSSQKSSIILNGETSEAIADFLSQKIKYNNSAKAQRSLMTTSLRNKIKERDGFKCQQCNVSTEEQSLLLLEIDHIIPVSKGGLSIPENLQTLCWKCNRTKSNKIIQ